MIDESNIKEVARAYCDATYGTSKEEPFIAEGFRQGAKWAQQEFIKNLWQAPAIEPKRGKDIIAISKKGEVYAFRYHVLSAIQKSFHDCNIERWCYLSDILPKEGGEE